MIQFIKENYFEIFLIVVILSILCMCNCATPVSRHPLFAGANTYKVTNYRYSITLRDSYIDDNNKPCSSKDLSIYIANKITIDELKDLQIMFREHPELIYYYFKEICWDYNKSLE